MSRTLAHEDARPEPVEEHAPAATGAPAESPSRPLPVLAEAEPVSGVRSLSGAMPELPPALIPAAQATAAAAGGFLAGAALLGLVHRRQRRAATLPGRRTARRGRMGRVTPRRGELVQIVASRSLLVDVHLLSER